MSLCLSFTTLSNAAELKVVIDRLEQDEDREIASKAEVDLAQMPSEAKFNACVPRESIPFPDSLPADIKSRIFSKEPLEALMSCRPEKCAYNFLPQEVEALSHLKNAEDRKSKYWEFYKNRVARKTGLQTNRINFHIKSAQNLIEDCNSPGLVSVLDDRMNKNAHFRLTHVQYQSQMRPTTRLLQSGYFRGPDKTFCYAESLIFSDHYDDDRVEVWSVKPSKDGAKFKVQVRHRIDILNTWVRRLQAKEGLAQELDKVLERQIRDAAACLTK